MPLSGMQLHREQNDCERGKVGGVKLRTNMEMKTTNGGRREVAMMTCLQAAVG
jgi:hypothetical protein